MNYTCKLFFKFMSSFQVRLKTMDTNKIPLKYTSFVLIYENLLILSLVAVNISPICSVHIMLFIKLYIPAMMIGLTSIWLYTCRMDEYTQRMRKRSHSLPMLVVYSIGVWFLGALIYHLNRVN